MLAKAYQKYLYIPRPVSKRYPMDVQHRAKQFAPFMNKGRSYPKNKNVDWIGSYRWFLLE